jgi:hypothetical protein
VNNTETALLNIFILVLSFIQIHYAIKSGNNFLRFCYGGAGFAMGYFAVKQLWVLATRL